MILLLAVLVVGLLRSHAEILRALHDLGVNLEDGAPPGRHQDLRPAHPRRRQRARPTEGVAPPGTAVAERVSATSGIAIPDDGPLGDAHDLMGVTPRGDAAAISVNGTERADPARVPDLRLRHLPGLLGRVPGPGEPCGRWRRAPTWSC